MKGFEVGRQITDLENLVARVKKGDATAARGLVEACWDMVCRCAVRLSSASGDSEDVAQEVFLKAFRSIETYEPGTNFRGWLLKITANHCIDVARARGSRPEVALKEGGHRAKAPGNPGQAAELRKTEEAVERAVRALPLRERTVLVLRVFEELSHKEIARAVGKTETTVRWHLCQARKKLRDSLAEFL